MTDSLSTQSTVERQRIRRILRDHAQLSIDVDSIDDGADLFDAGLDSQAAAYVMLGLEASFDIEFPESMLTCDLIVLLRTAACCAIVAALDAAVRELRAEAA